MKSGGNRTSRWISGAVIAGVLAALSSCTAEKDPPESSVSWLAPQTRAAKPFDCALPMLSALPNADYQEIAIVEVADDYNADNQELYGLARRKGCETGADALVILEDQRQERGKPLPGYSADEGKDVGPESGANVRAREHNATVGEEGHKGRILNAVAIIYKNANTAGAASPGNP
jgi:hypothetical protein